MQAMNSQEKVIRDMAMRFRSVNFKVIHFQAYIHVSVF